MNLYKWAARWNIPQAALGELLTLFGAVSTEPQGIIGESEAAVQACTRLEASKQGGRLWRNNVGACYTPEGSFIRFGLCNDSAKMNAEIKSADLIGLKPVQIKPEHIGLVIGQFWAREVKEGAWVYTGTKREKAQLVFLKLVASLGGDAAFISKGDDLK